MSAQNPAVAGALPAVTLYTGAKMPQVGLGTWLSKPGEVGNAVRVAIEHGCRHIDCAHVYGNEAEIGEALSSILSPSTSSNDTATAKADEKSSQPGDAGAVARPALARSELFVTSKLWNTSHHPEDVEPALRLTLKNLQLEYLDLYLIHWPHGFKRGDGDFPKDAAGNVVYDEDVDYVDTWKALEECVAKGLCKHIGLSNFNSKQIQRVLSVAKIRPAVLQVECHPYLTQDKLIAFARQHNIAVTGYSPLGSPKRPWAAEDEVPLLADPRLVPIAEKYGKSVAQVLIRFQVDRGVIVIPKSVTPARVRANLEVRDFSLTPEEIKTVSSFHRGWRACALARDEKHKYFPFREEF